MKTSVENLLTSARKKMSGYAALYNYRMHNLSVKADPEALLSISVELEEEELPIEKVAWARNAEGRDDQFEIFPMARKLLVPIVKGIKSVHPEYDLDLRNVNDDEEEEEELKEKYILATMPVVDDNRHDVMPDGVKLLSDACEAQLKATFTRYSAEIALQLADAPAGDLDEAKDALQELYDTATDLCKQFRENKEKEIEDAYQLYLAGKEEKEMTEQEEQAAHNAQAGLKMKLNPDEDE